MANDLNRCDFIGNLGADPEIRYQPSGGAVANVRIACNWKGKEKEGTEWVPIVFFGRLAEIVGEYLRKGSKIYVSGKFRTRKWTDQSGNDRYTTEIVASELQMLDSRGDGGQRKAPQQSQQEASTPAPADDFDDDIPF